MSNQIKTSVKELYGSVKAPEELRKKTLAAVKDGHPEKKAKILHANFKVIGTVAACLVLCLGLFLSGILREGEITVSVDGHGVLSNAAVCNSQSIEYTPAAMPISAKNTGCTLSGDAVKLDVSFNGEISVDSTGQLAAENSDGQIFEISDNAEIRDISAIYVITDGMTETEVTLTSERDAVTLTIHENSDGTFTVGIK